MHLIRDRKFFQLAVKRAGGNAERFRSFGFVSMGLSKRFLDNAALAFFDVADRSCADFFAPAGGVMLQVHGQIADRNIIAVGNHHGAFDDAFKLADVARPRIVEK